MVRINNTQYFHFLQQADALRHSGSLCDAIISVRSQTFRAHRLVLACASRWLAQQLAVGDTDSPVHCTLEYFSPHTFQQVLDFTYTQSLEVSEDDLHLLLRAAKLLEMQPLEEQCQKQLDNLHCSEESKRREIIYVIDEKESAETRGQKPKGRPVQHEKLRDTCPPEDETCNTFVTENIPPSDPTKSPDSPQPPRKKQRLPPGSEIPHRESVITRPPGSSDSFSSAWSFSNMWNSMSTLRQLAQNYSNLVAVHPLQSPDQSAVAYPFSFTTPYMFPLFGSHCQSSVMGYSDFHSGYIPNLYAGSTGAGNIIKQGLLKRKKPSQRAFTRTFQVSQPSYHDAAKASTEGLKDCQQRSTSLADDPALQEPASTPPGEGCTRCRVGERGNVAEQQSNQQGQRGEKPYQCQHCTKKFSLKHQLDTHLRVHTGEKPFECRICNQRSRDYSAMIKHLRTHGGASPYQCTVCMEFCNSLVAMQRHIKNHAVQDFPPGWSINSTYLYISHI